jgi:hypothetical protein
MQRRSVPASEQKQKHRSGSGQDLATVTSQGQELFLGSEPSIIL